MAVDFCIIGKRLKQARKKKKITQAQLSEMIDVSVAFLSKIETGKVHLNIARLSQICGILGVPEGDILNGSSKDSENYLYSDFFDLLKKCSEEKQKLAYKILQLVASEP